MKKKFIIVLIVMFSLFMLIPTKVMARKTYSGKIVDISCEGVRTYAQIYEISGESEDVNDNTYYGGAFSNNYNHIKEKQLFANNNNKNEFYITAASASGSELTKIEAEVYSSNGSKCGTFVIGEGPFYCGAFGAFSCGKKYADGANIKFSNTSFSDENSYIRLKAYSHHDTKGDREFSIDFNKNSIENIISAKTDAEIIAALNDTVAGNTTENANNNAQEETLDDIEDISDSETEVEASADVRKIKCDKEISDLIHKYWKWVMFITPLLLIVMITLDFIKAMSSEDADSIKKSASNTVKRVIAAIILLALPWALDVIFGWFGLQICF